MVRNGSRRFGRGNIHLSPVAAGRGSFRDAVSYLAPLLPPARCRCSSPDPRSGKQRRAARPSITRGPRARSRAAEPNLGRINSRAWVASRES